MPHDEAWNANITRLRHASTETVWHRFVLVCSLESEAELVTNPLPKKVTCASLLSSSNPSSSEAHSPQMQRTAERRHRKGEVKSFTLLSSHASSLRRGHADLLCHRSGLSGRSPRGIQPGRQIIIQVPRLRGPSMWQIPAEDGPGEGMSLADIQQTNPASRRCRSHDVGLV